MNDTNPEHRSAQSPFAYGLRAWTSVVVLMAALSAVGLYLQHVADRPEQVETVPGPSFPNAERGRRVLESLPEVKTLARKPIIWGLYTDKPQLTLLVDRDGWDALAESDRDAVGEYMSLCAYDASRYPWLYTGLGMKESEAPRLWLMLKSSLKKDSWSIYEFDPENGATPAGTLLASGSEGR